MAVVALKAIIAALLMWLAYFIVKRVTTVQTNYLPLLVGAIVRIALFSVIYISIKGEVPSDVPGYYYPQAKAALSGAVWNADFQSSYSPLFPYLGAVLLTLWDHPLVFVVFALILDWVVLLIWTTVYFNIDPKGSCIVSMVYACSGPVILNALVGQQQAWVGAGLAVSAWLIICRKRVVYSGLVQGITIITTKILPLIFWPSIAAVSRRPLIWTVSAVTLPILTALTFFIMGSDLLAGIHAEQQDFTSGNIIYYIDYLLNFGSTMPEIYDAFTATSLCVAISLALYLIFQNGTESNYKAQEILFSSALVLAVLLLMSKKSYANYLPFAYFPFLYVLYKTVSVKNFWIVSSLLSVTGSIQTSLWFAQRGKGYWLAEWVAREGWNVVLPTVFVECILLSIYGLIIWCSIRGLRDLRYLKASTDKKQ